MVRFLPNFRSPFAKEDRWSSIRRCFSEGINPHYSLRLTLVVEWFCKLFRQLPYWFSSARYEPLVCYSNCQRAFVLMRSLYPNFRQIQDPFFEKLFFMFFKVDRIGVEPIGVDRQQCCLRQRGAKTQTTLLFSTCPNCQRSAFVRQEIVSELSPDTRPFFEKLFFIFFKFHLRMWKKGL